MSDIEAFEGTAEDASTELVPAPAPPALAVTPTVQAAELVERLDVIRDAMQTAMTEGVDYGVIPNTSKPTLLKPGAEKLGVLFQLDVQLTNEKTWGPGEHLTVESKAVVSHAPSGVRLGYGEGLCTTREKKYAKRKQERLCPSCGTAAVIKGQEQYGGGWLCWKKKDGCGAKWRDGDPVIESQDVGEIENPDLPDLYNTVVKMAMKRARVDAVLAVTGASALFTQDVEDMAPASAPVPRETSNGATEASDWQKNKIRKGLKGLTAGTIKAVFTKAGVFGVEDVVAAVDGLAKHQASAVIDVLAQGALPDPEHPGLDNDASDFTHPPTGGDAFGDPDRPEDDPERQFPLGDAA